MAEQTENKQTFRISPRREIAQTTMMEYENGISRSFPIRKRTNQLL